MGQKAAVSFCFVLDFIHNLELEDGRRQMGADFITELMLSLLCNSEGSVRYVRYVWIFSLIQYIIVIYNKIFTVVFRMNIANLEDPLCMCVVSFDSEISISGPHSTTPRG